MREFVIRVLITVVGIYFLYGIYSMYTHGMLSLPW